MNARFFIRNEKILPKLIHLYDTEVYIFRFRKQILPVLCKIISLLGPSLGEVVKSSYVSQNSFNVFHEYEYEEACQ